MLSKHHSSIVLPLAEAVLWLCLYLLKAYVKNVGLFFFAQPNLYPDPRSPTGDGRGQQSAAAAAKAPTLQEWKQGTKQLDRGAVLRFSRTRGKYDVEGKGKARCKPPACQRRGTNTPSQQRERAAKKKQGCRGRRPLPLAGKAKEGICAR